MCKYCEKGEKIYDELTGQIEILKDSILVRKRVGNIFDAITVNTQFNIFYCPMCRKKIKRGRTRKMSEDLKLQLAVLAKNTITLICFTILSVVFNHWWIIFFAIIFITTVEKVEVE